MNSWVYSNVAIRRRIIRPIQWFPNNNITCLYETRCYIFNSRANTSRNRKQSRWSSNDRIDVPEDEKQTEIVSNYEILVVFRLVKNDVLSFFNQNDTLFLKSFVRHYTICVGMQPRNGRGDGIRITFHILFDCYTMFVHPRVCSKRQGIHW